MWRSRLIAQRSRATLRLSFHASSRNNAPHGALGVVVPSWIEEEEDRKSVHVQQRRCLSIGRRHGWKGESEKKPKQNFAEEYLEPAARGELKEKHSSGIPKLAVRKHKGRNLQGNFGDDAEDSDLFEDLELDDESDLSDEDGLVGTMSKDIRRARAESEKKSGGLGGGGAGGRDGGGGGGVVPGRFPNKSLALSPHDRPEGAYTL